MRIAVANGKGGTGKTTVATSLALLLDAATTLVLDCDVEAPNAHLTRVTRAMVQRLPVTCYRDTVVAQSLREVWTRVLASLDGRGG